jgi:hypothetical protein
MSLQRWQETYISGSTDGPTLTAAARASCIPTAERKPLPVEWLLGRKLHIRLSGRISCVVTTPGTARIRCLSRVRRHDDRLRHVGVEPQRRRENDRPVGAGCDALRARGRSWHGDDALS